MSIAFLMVFGGFVLVISGWKNVSFTEALRGNFDVPKPAHVAVASPPASTVPGRAGG